MSDSLESGREPAPATTVEVLVVEDDPDIAETLALMLEERGYRTATAGNGCEALALLARGVRPAVILLDLTMPVMDGAQFRGVQLQSPSLAEIPVVVVTADAAADRGALLNAPGWLLKPVALDALLTVVASYCGERTDR